MSLGRPIQGRGKVQASGTHESQGEFVKCFGRQTWTTEMEDEGVKWATLKWILKKYGANLTSGFFVVGRVQWQNILSTMTNL
jgi:hypothetical protein